MSTLTVSIPDEDFEFLQTLAASSGITAEDYLAQQTRLLRERMQRPLHPAVIALSGIISDKVDVKKEYIDHMEKKHS